MSRSLPGPLIGITLCLGLSPELGAQTTFTEIADDLGLVKGYDAPLLGFGASVAAVDYDDDGFIDLFFPTEEGTAHRLYRNQGDGTFEEVAEAVGLGRLDRGRSALWLDYDGDHRLDLLISHDCYLTTCDGLTGSFGLFRQTSKGTFDDVTLNAGLSGTFHASGQHPTGFAAGDVNGDGFLDFVTGYWDGPLRLFLNQGDGTFLDGTLLSGMDDTVRHYHQPVMHDFDGNGLPDIFAAVDFTENLLWLNQGVTSGYPSFIESGAEAGCDNAMNDMGAAVGDYDGDLDADLYVTNIFSDGEHNILLRNDQIDQLQFADVSAQAGVQDGAWGWGATFLDVDHDMDLDLVETNGWHNVSWEFPLRLFIHQGDDPPTFVDGAASAGLTDSYWGSSIVAFDFDRDGDLDLAETCPDYIGQPRDDELNLYRNDLDRSSGDRKYLVIRPRMDGPNRWAIGARVIVEVDGASLVRWIGAGTSFLGQEPAEAFFGLGSHSVVDRLTITWPGGDQTVVTDVPTDQVKTISDAGIFSSGFESGDLAAWSP